MTAKQIKRARFWMSMIVGVTAYVVMPDGPWYRQVGAALLVILAHEVRTDGEFARLFLEDPAE